MKLKLNDVYRFTYNEEIVQKLSNPYWCFDGQLIVKQESDGEFYLEDTYWGSSNSKKFTLEEALKLGKLKFICNLDDVEKIREHEVNYYDDQDLFTLFRQHGCYRDFYKRKGAQKSVAKMEEYLKRKIESIKSEIKWQKMQLEIAEENLKKLREGNIDIIYL